MKKIIVALTVVLFFTANVVNAQYKLQEGQGQLNAGVGFSTHWGNPVYVGFDLGVHRYISVGAEASFRVYNDNDRDRQSVLGLLVNGNFHFSGLLGFKDTWDPYMGLNLGMGYRNNLSTNITSTIFGFGGQFGVRYYFNDNFGINLELGGGTIFDWGKFGISYAF